VCTPAACDAPNGDHYCGVIGDQCGNTLDCGTTCPNAGWLCKNNMCKGGSTCTALTCVASSADSYCGAIGDGCGGTLDCGSTCPKPGWECVDGLCKAGPTSGCLCRRTCTTANGRPVLRNIGDGCGNSLDCGTTCTKNGWTCKDNLCKAVPRLAVCRWPAPRPTATSTARPSETGAATRSTAERLARSPDGPAKTTCARPGRPSCAPLACTTANGDQYCGPVGDGCGNSLDCGSTCSKPGWTCEDNLCKGAPGVCAPLTCSPASGGHYCGTIGDGCGHSLVATRTARLLAAAGCAAASNACVGGAGCVKTTCNNTKWCAAVLRNHRGRLRRDAELPGDVRERPACGETSAHVCDSCGNLCLKQVRCDGGATTSISGKVYDPAGYNPLYNVIVSIPNAALDPIPTGASCTPATPKCRASRLPLR
jgi:hypothetical protein